MNNLIAGLAAIVLGGCAPPPSIIDQCLRADLFQRCMKSLPAGPASTKYNDWDEVVGACDNVSYYQSKRAEANVKHECRDHV